MKTKTLWTTTALVIAVIAIAAWGISESAHAPSSRANKGPIKIGAVISLTSFAAPWGEYDKNGMDLAVKSINAAGGIDGRLVELITEDDHTDGKQGVSAFNKLISVDGVGGVIGGTFDFTAQPLMPLALNDKVPFISGSNFRIAGGFELNDQSFVMLTDFDKTISKLEPYIAASPIKKLVVVHYQSTFGNEISKTLDGVMKGLGRGGAVDEAYPQIGMPDWKTTILKLKSQSVDAVFLDMVGTDPLNFLRQARQLGFAPTVMTYNGIADAFAGQSDTSLLEGVVILNWEVATSQFADMYHKAYGVPATKSADKYFKAVYVMAQAIAATDDPSAAAAYIVSHTFQTPDGAVSFDPDHSVKDTQVDIQVFKGGVQTEWRR